jgi:hypothetical protein
MTIQMKSRTRLTSATAPRIATKMHFMMGGTTIWLMILTTTVPNGTMISSTAYIVSILEVDNISSYPRIIFSLYANSCYLYDVPYACSHCVRFCPRSRLRIDVYS